jgi:maltooligosyltrehalose trehalohydrolase
MDFERLKLGAAMMMLSPYVPMLFRARIREDNPFYYFVSHLDPELVEAVRKGRKEDFPDLTGTLSRPIRSQKQTFNQSKLSWEKRKTGKHTVLLTGTKSDPLRRKKSPCRASTKMLWTSALSRRKY